MIKPSPVAVDLIKRFEGYRRSAIKLPDGRWTIVHGHTRTARQGAEVSEADAEALLIYDLMAVTAAIDEHVFTPLTQNQFDALISFVFNIGVDNFLHSAVLRRLNEGALIEAAFALEIWRRADFEGERIVMDALVRRRAAEKALFLTPQEGWIATPTPVVEPRADYRPELAAPPPRPESNPEIDESPDMLTQADDGLSPPQRAAAALAARLRAVIPEPEPPPTEPVEAAEPAAFPSEPAEAAPPIEPAALPAKPPTPPAHAEALRRAIFGIPEPRPKAVPRGGSWPLWLLGGAGLVVFIGAVTWAFRAKTTSLQSSQTLAMIFVGLIGIMGVASAVYFLLERMGGRDEGV